MAGGPVKAKRGGFRSGASLKKRSSPDDDEPAPRASNKKAKSGGDDEESVFVPKLQQDDEGHSFVPLKANGLRRVTVNDFKGTTFVHVREVYETDAGEIKPGKKGISLTIDQYNAFVSALPLLESALVEMGEKVVRPDYEGGGEPLAGGDDAGEDETVAKEQDDDAEDE